MSQSSHSVGNVSAPAFRAAMNDSLQALASLNSGATAPSTTYANMLWYDTAANILYMRSEADDAWIVIGTLNQSTNTFIPAGSLTLASQAEAEAGTDNTKVMTPLRVAQSILANTPEGYTDAQARAAQAGHSFGGVGSYAFLFKGDNVVVGQGDTFAGSSLFPAGFNNSAIPAPDADASTLATQGSSALSGTWRAMGRSAVSSAGNRARLTLFLRIS